jgi:hypothetical protein
LPTAHPWVAPEKLTEYNSPLSGDTFSGIQPPAAQAVRALSPTTDVTAIAASKVPATILAIERAV